jgi:hypothetical protein
MMLESLLIWRGSGGEYFRVLMLLALDQSWLVNEWFGFILNNVIFTSLLMK